MKAVQFTKGQQVKFKKEHQDIYGRSIYTFSEINSYSLSVAIAYRGYEKGNYTAQKIAVAPDMLELA